MLLRVFKFWPILYSTSGSMPLNLIGSQILPDRGIYFSESRAYLFLPYLFHHTVKLFPHFMHTFWLFLLEFLPNFNFGWNVSLPKKQGICKNIYHPLSPRLGQWQLNYMDEWTQVQLHGSAYHPDTCRPIYHDSDKSLTPANRWLVGLYLRKKCVAVRN